MLWYESGTLHQTACLQRIEDIADKASMPWPGHLPSLFLRLQQPMALSMSGTAQRARYWLCIVAIRGISIVWPGHLIPMLLRSREAIASFLAATMALYRPGKRLPPELLLHMVAIPPEYY